MTKGGNMKKGNDGLRFIIVFFIRDKTNVFWRHFLSLLSINILSNIAHKCIEVNRYSLLHV